MSEVLFADVVRVNDMHHGVAVVRDNRGTLWLHVLEALEHFLDTGGANWENVAPRNEEEIDLCWRARAVGIEVEEPKADYEGVEYDATLDEARAIIMSTPVYADNFGVWYDWEAALDARGLEKLRVLFPDGVVREFLGDRRGEAMNVVTEEYMAFVPDEFIDEFREQAERIRKENDAIRNGIKEKLLMELREHGMIEG